MLIRYSSFLFTVKSPNLVFLLFLIFTKIFNSLIHFLIKGILAFGIGFSKLSINLITDKQ